ncbi:MAG TPA: prepilin-type N-terminal cleavage/methylation domain-containing protein [Patescibacteria group bacterium]|nr:prepilin-type N-terminal cleavage/methylation domain-containing protein [Patescibacteria group bacterium]
MGALSRKILNLRRKKTVKGFTLIEIMIVVAIIAIFLLIALWAYRLQLLKGRDARRKADLATWQNLLEDYANDSVCYPEGMVVCGPTQGEFFEGYLSEIPCDPLNNVYYNYMYTFEEGSGCNKWYKIYTKLENENDPIIAKVGCDSNVDCPSGGCGPGCNYNYWVSSPNVTEVARLPGEFWVYIPGEEPPPGETPPGEEPSEEPPPGEFPPEIPLEAIPTCKTVEGTPWCWKEICRSCCPDTYSPYYYFCDKGDSPGPEDDKCILDLACKAD